MKADGKIFPISTLVNFLAWWTLMNAVCGLVAYTLETGLILLGVPYVALFGILAFEFILFVLRWFFFRRWKDFLPIRGIDTYAWLLSGVFFMLMGLLDITKNTPDVFTPSLMVPQWGGFILFAFSIAFWLAGLVSASGLPALWRRIKRRFAKPSITWVALFPAMAILSIIGMVLLGVAALLLTLITLGLIIAPIELFFSTLHFTNLALERILYGLFSTTWIGIVTGPVLILALPWASKLYQSNNPYYRPEVFSL